MSLISSIQTIAETLYPDATFKLSSHFQANVTSHGLEVDALPFIILDNELPANAEIKLNNNVQNDWRVLIWILYLDSEDNTDAQSQVLVDDAMEIADRLAVNIYQLPAIRPNGNQKYKKTPSFHIFQSNLTGVFLEMNANENVIVSFCPTNPEE